MRLQLVLAIAFPVLASTSVSCRGAEEGGEPELPGPTILPGSRGAPVQLRRSRELDEIAQLEDERSDGGGRLLEFLKTHEDPEVRARAAVALGRLPYPRFGAAVTDVLSVALDIEPGNPNVTGLREYRARFDESTWESLVLRPCLDAIPLSRARAHSLGELFRYQGQQCDAWRSTSPAAPAAPQRAGGASSSTRPAAWRSTRSTVR